jgi:hypothetical protein
MLRSNGPEGREASKGASKSLRGKVSPLRLTRDSAENTRVELNAHGPQRRDALILIKS